MTMARERYDVPSTRSTFHVTRRSSPDGSGSMELELNLRDAPSPSREYVAHIASVDRDDGMVRLTFAQRQRPKGGLRNMIVVVMTADNAARFVRSCETFLPKILDYLKRVGVDVRPLAVVEEEPASTVEMFANVVSAAQALREASMDFYRIPVPEVRRLVTNPSVPGIDVEPVVRVTLSTELLAAVINGLESLNLHTEES